jgi:hypothetical protein
MNVARRREFTPAQRAEIVARATDAIGTIRCERCSLAQKPGSFEIDHIIAEGLRPTADKKAKLTIADGQLLGNACCHRGEGGKTNDDVAKIAKAKRCEAKHVGIARPKQSIRSAGFQKAPAKEPKQIPANQSYLYRLWSAGRSTGEGT